MAQTELAGRILLRKQAAGLRVVNISILITSLIVTWLRRQIMFSENDTWSGLIKINFAKLFSIHIDTYCST